MNMNKASYYLGMTFAFVECVCNDAKEIALTHPLSENEFSELKELNEKIIHENQLHVYWDTTYEHHIGIIYKYNESLQKYIELRQNFNIIDHFEAFKSLLGYDIVYQMNGYTKINTTVVQSEDWLFNKQKN